MTSSPTTVGCLLAEVAEHIPEASVIGRHTKGGQAAVISSLWPVRRSKTSQPVPRRADVLASKSRRARGTVLVDVRVGVATHWTIRTRFHPRRALLRGFSFIELAKVTKWCLLF